MLYARNGMTMSDWRAFNLGRFLGVARMASDGDYRSLGELIADLETISEEYLRDETHTQTTKNTQRTEQEH